MKNYCIAFLLCLFWSSQMLAQRSAYDEAAFLNAAAAEGDTSTALESLQTGLDVNYKRSTKTALHFAIFFKRAEMVKFLLRKGADPAITDDEGNTALQLAQKYSSPEIIAILKKGGKAAPEPVKDAPSKTPSPVAPFAVGSKVLHSRNYGKTWEPGTVLKIPAGEFGYLVENEQQTVQNYYDPVFVTTLERQSSWTSVFAGDWDLYLPMAYSDKVIGKDVYRTYGGVDRLPPLRINANGTYSWAVSKTKVVRGRWKAVDHAPGIVLLKGQNGADWRMYNTTDDVQQKIFKTDCVMLVADGNTSRHGFRITKK